MQHILASSPRAREALDLVSSLQQRFAELLEDIAADLGMHQSFSPVRWQRDEGRHGGGMRLETADGPMIGRGSINVSQVHYDDEPARRLGSATAISTIIHPFHPLAPSIHIHISWTEMKQQNGYWRIMADLNPAIPEASDAASFEQALRQAAPAHFHQARQQGDRYFFIPALGRHRGIVHFYLEQFNSGDFDADHELAARVGKAAVDTYGQILRQRLKHIQPPSKEQMRAQLDYHTLYFFQVLTLDRGTTSGLLVHDQNDLGIMGSLPARVDRALLQSWVPRMCSPQDELLQALINALPNESPCTVDAACKKRLADTVRRHYQQHPEAISMQATADVVPPTVINHMPEG
ncbi:MAG: coproporphyrinogen III oxidase [Zetaproteobacteria bacterium]|nr:MAG: coproporphyrinogen III oxidase [Zetaproteobacteria bacterium]